MDAKDLRTEAVLGDRSNDGNTKYVQGDGSLACHRNKAYQDITSNSLAKVDTPQARPCAVIGPDRVVPPAPPAHTDVYYKKSPQEPWLTPENTYRRPPDYPYKLLDYQHPTRNISPRQTFQENMQRIMVAPSYNAGKLKEDQNYPGEQNISQMRNKLTVPPDSNSKYCDVPYTVNPTTNDHKNVRNSDISVSNMNNVLSRSMPHGWAPTSANIPPSKPLPQDLCQYPEYQNCPVSRPLVMARPHRPVHEEHGTVYPDSFYHNGNIRFKPYPQVKERYPQTRYEYIGNYSNPFHPPPPFPTHKYDLQKPMPPHPYPNYQQVPLKYLDNRMTDSIMSGYQRSLNQQAAYSSMPYRNQVIHPTYGPVPGTCLPSNKFYPYPPDAAKSLPSNKLPFDNNNKLYPDYEQSNRSKNFPVSDAFYINEIARPHLTKGQIVPPNYPSNIHAMPTHPYYRKEPLKGYEYSPHFRNMDHMIGANGNLMSRFPSQFSPSAIAISPSDSNTSNETNLTHAVSQEDFGYVSQSSTASARSMDSIINKVPLDMYRRYDQGYGHNIIRGSAPFAKIDHSANNNLRSKKDKKDIDVRQFLQMWNEGEEEGSESNNKELNIKQSPINPNNSVNVAGATNQEQLYVLGLVNVPSEELSKYQHIQKVSKLPENIKGYNSIELLHQFEEVIESSNLNHYNDKPATKSFQNTFKNTVPMHGLGIPSRPLSPLDVEAKISQSVIHKEVGCNFEIKPCSPKMLNVEVATPVQTVIGERIIEKVSNPLIGQSPVNQNVGESRDDCKVVKSQDRLSVHDNAKIASCKMVSKLYGSKDLVDPVKTNYSIQDLESNSGVCLASLPRLDNDIELNFPEVNQQFINANKVDSVITTGPIKDLPPLDTDQSDPLKHEQEIDVFNSHMKRNPEKDSSKLSKYRKMKRVSGSSTPESNVQALRTDSVIIKNPENCKHENFEKSVSPRTLSPKTTSQEAQNDPINLSVNNEYCERSNTFDFDINKSMDEKPNDFAIDFSINANESSSFTNDLTLPEISPTEKQHTNGAIVVKKELNKKCVSPSHTSTVLSKDNVLNASDINKPHECKEYDINKSAFSIETSALKKINDATVNYSETYSKEELESKKEINGAVQNTNSEQLQKYIVTNNEILNSKLSSYNLLSSQEKEDTLNEKMRELFGEEFSTAETEPDFEEVHDTQAILDDEATQAKDCIFSDESLQQDDEKTLKCNTSDDCKKEERNNLSNDTMFHNLTETNKIKNYIPRDSSTSIAVTTEVYEHSKIIHNEILEVKTKIYENPTNADLQDCLVEHKNSESDLCRIKKELLSPWIQKLILYNEGLYAINDVIENRNADDQKDASDSEKVETSNNFENTAIVNCKSKNSIVLETITDGETVQFQNHEMDLDTGLQNVYPDENTKSLVSMAKDLETGYHGIDKNLAHGIELQNSLEFSKTPEQTLASGNKTDKDNFSVVLDENDHIYDEFSEGSDKFRTHSHINVENNISCDLLQTNASDIEEISNENSTNETKKGCDNMEKHFNVSKLIHSSENIKNISSEAEISCTSNDNGAHKGQKDSDKPEIKVHDLIVSDNTISSEKLEKNTAQISDATVNYKTDENMKNLIESDETENLESAVDLKTDKEVTNSKLKNSSYDDILERTIHNTEEGKLESDDFEITLNKKPKATNADSTKQNLENHTLENETNTCYQEAESDIDRVEVCVNNISTSSDIGSDDSETVSKESHTNSPMTMKGMEDTSIISDHKVDSETFYPESKSENDNKCNCMHKIENSDINKELDLKNHNDYDNPDTQFVKNFQSEHSLSSNNKSKSRELLSTLESSADQCNITFGKDQESFNKNNSLAMDSSVDRLLTNTIDSTGSDKKSTTIKIKNYNNIISDYKIESRPYNEDLKNDNEIQIKNTDSSKSGLYLHEETECTPFLLLSSEENQGAFHKTKITEKSISVSHLGNPMASSQDYSVLNTKEPIHTVCDQRSEDCSTKNRILYENPDENCSQFEVTENKQLISGGISNEDNVATSVHNMKQSESSSSDASDDTSSSDDENSSDSTDSSEFLDNEETKTSFDDSKNLSNFTAEQEHNLTSHSSSFIKSNNFLSEVKNNTEINLNNKPTFNRIVEKNIAVLNHENEEIDPEYIIQESNCEEFTVDSLNELIFNDPNMLSESEKNETEQAVTNCSEIASAEVDFSADENDMGDSGFVLETSLDVSKHEDIVEDAYNEVQLPNNCKNLKYPNSKRRKSLKRSLSDSALDDIRDNFEDDSVVWPNKRKKDMEINNYNTSQLIAQNICRVLQSNRRNSISSIHNDGNVSFCILIDNNCIISEDCDEAEKICLSEVPEDCVTCIKAESVNQNSTEDMSSHEQDTNCVFSTPVETNEDDKILNEPWVEDVACVETVISEDIAENIVISASASPRDEECNAEETENYNINEHTEKLKFIYGDKMYTDDAHFVNTLYRTPQMNVNKTLSNRESQITIDDSRYYDKESLERVLSESNGQDKCTDSIAFQGTTPSHSPIISELSPNYSENVILSENHNIRTSDRSLFESKEYYVEQTNQEEYKEYPNKEIKENINCCESIEDVYNYTKPEEKRNISSSPEVSSTTSEEKNAGILLKITSFSGSRVSQINNTKPIQSISCKYTEKKEYLSSNGNLPTRTLITKAAQKYIPPIKESIRDLKVKLPLPQQSLVKLRQLKMSKEAPKPNLDRSANTFTKNVPKKSKPKFEDVLMSIDELQYQKQKEEKNKKGRKSIPKVVIKKNLLGSHYASTSSKHRFNPDLTGRKWQPWVFLERDHFIDKMALRNKTHAVFSHRKKSYVLAEKFQKYKSICNPKFVISQPKQNDSTSGQLKYTIRLKHTY